MTRAKAKELGISAGSSATSTECSAQSERKSLKRKMVTDENVQPTKKQRQNVDKVSQQIAVVRFLLGEIIWAKIRGSPHWPAQIMSFPTHNTAEVLWFNDYRRTKVFQTKLFKFLPYFDEFAKKFETHVGLETAAREALACYGNKFITQK